MATPTTISFKWHKITSDEFAKTTDKFEIPVDVVMTISIGFSFVIEEKLIGVHPKCIFVQLDKHVMTIANSFIFKILEEDWNAIFEPAAKKITIPRSIALHFTSLAIGGTRGILHSKTENTPFNNLILPSVDLNAIVVEDVIIIEDIRG